MSAVSIDKSMAGTISVPSYETPVRLWRRTYKVDDPRADVGRKLGDGSARQGKIVLATIIEAAKKWFDTENKEARAAYTEARRRCSSTARSRTTRARAWLPIRATAGS